MSDRDRTERRLTARLRRLREELAHAGPLVEATVVLPRSGERYTIARPSDTDLLLDLAADDPEQNLPYWAEIWPSGIALADAIAQRPALLREQAVLEIGCGLGITACAALAAGARLTVTDYSADALTLCALNTLRNTEAEPTPLQINWRHLEETLFDLGGTTFPVVLAADVLYESRDIAPLLLLLGKIVAPGGLLWLAEPGRPPATRFLEAASELGWSAHTDPHLGPWPDPKDTQVRVAIHTLQRR